MAYSEVTLMQPQGLCQLLYLCVPHSSMTVKGHPRPRQKAENSYYELNQALTLELKQGDFQSSN